MANGDLKKLGTFYLGGVKQLRPTRPYAQALYSSRYGNNGNIPLHTDKNANIEIRDTDANDAYKIQWREVNIDGKTLYISDRVLLSGVNWGDLNTKGLITGKNVTIDGNTYKLRVLTGGNASRSGSRGFYGGNPTTNEWDRIIVNESNFSGLPVPNWTEMNRDDMNHIDNLSTHNDYWNWYGVHSWCQESLYTTSHTLRGHFTVTWFDWSDDYYDIIVQLNGWRPVLELIPNNPPTVGCKTTGSVTIPNGGSVTSTYGQNYPFKITGNDADTSNTIQYTVLVNGVTVQAYTSCTRGVEFTYTIPSASLTLGNNTVQVKVKDSSNAEVSMSFTVVNQAVPTAILKQNNGTVLTANKTVIKYDKNAFSFKITPNDANVSTTIQYTVLINSTTIQAYVACTKNVEITQSIPFANILNGTNTITVKIKNSLGTEITSTFVLYQMVSLCLKDLYTALNQ